MHSTNASLTKSPSSPAIQSTAGQDIKCDRAKSRSGISCSAGRNIDIEALRTFAILVTIVAHLGILLPSLTPSLSYFWLGGGVDLFFCISGFVITMSLVNAMSKETSDHFIRVVVPFWIRRIFRVWPAAIFWVFVIMMATLVFNRSGIFGNLVDNFDFSVAAVAQVENIHIASCVAVGSPYPCAGGAALQVYWSLSLEEQFYILFPFLLLTFPRKRLVLLLIVIISLQFFATRTWPSLLWFTRTDAICFGVLIALFTHARQFSMLNFEFFERPLLRLPVVFGLLATLIVVARPNVVSFYHGLTALISAFLVFLASFDSGYIADGKTARRIFLWAGKRSYSLYLTHCLAYCLTRELYFRCFDGQPVSVRSESAAVIVAVALMFCLTAFSVRVIEKNLRDIGRRISRQILLAPPCV